MTSSVEAILADAETSAILASLRAQAGPPADAARYEALYLRCAIQRIAASLRAIVVAEDADLAAYAAAEGE